MTTPAAAAAGAAAGGGIPRAGSLPVGILLVGVGGVLLFVAFHNVPDNITNFAGLLGWIAADMRGNVSGKPQGATTSAAPPPATAGPPGTQVA